MTNSSLANERGFTLIELMIVVAIIAILAMVISPKFVVCPMGYVHLGIWVRDDVDLSLYNPATGTEALHWLGFH